MKKEALDKLTEKALEYLESTEAFVGEQVPRYIEELLGYKVFENVVDLVIGLGFFGTLIFSLGLLYLGATAEKESNGIKKFIYEKTPDRGEVVAAVGGVFTGVFLLVNSISFFDLVVPATKNIYKIKTAPRVYLVDYFSKGLK